LPPEPSGPPRGSPSGRQPHPEQSKPGVRIPWNWIIPIGICVVVVLVVWFSRR